jgi:hypothetical protein
MQRSEETWVQNPASAWVYQDDALHLSVSSFLTRLHHLHRLRWMLRDPADEEEKAEVLGFLDRLAALVAITPEAVDAEAERVDARAKATALELAKDLNSFLADLPASSRLADWRKLVEQTRGDYLSPSNAALEEMDSARRTVLKRANSRFTITASPENAAALTPLLAHLAERLRDARREPRARQAPGGIARRVMEREKLGARPSFVALPAPNMQGGVFINSAPFVPLTDTSEEGALRFLSSKLYGGGGPHGVFMKTWGAGLAYSNGLRSSASEGRIHYYAERTPALLQTLAFVIAELKRAPRDLPLAEYALSQVFLQSRADGSFEGRTAAMAEDLVDGFGPENVRAFRQAVLDLRAKPDLNELLRERMDAAYAKVLPGYGPAAPDAISYVIGPEKQLAAWEAYLKDKAGSSLVRLAPRDYWVEVE